jgi:hypothetical protein
MKTALILAGIGLSLAILIVPLFILALLLLEPLFHSRKS